MIREEKTVTIDGLKVHYIVQGAGAPLVLMPGWGCNSTTVRAVADVAAQSNTVYSLDLPGFGLKGIVPVQSEEPTETWGTDDFVEFLHRFISELELERPTLIGHSFGGRIAIAYAAKYPTEKLVLIDSAGVVNPKPLATRLKIRWSKFVRWAATTLLGKEQGNAWLERHRGNAGSEDYRLSTPRMRAIMSRCINEDLRDRMPRIDVPVLLLWGENDTATPLIDAQKMLDLMPKAGLVPMAGCGHYPFVDNPGLFSAVLASFLKS